MDPFGVVFGVLSHGVTHHVFDNDITSKPLETPNQ
jgi:hypothetical protein